MQKRTPGRKMVVGRLEWERVPRWREMLGDARVEVGVAGGKMFGGPVAGAVVRGYEQGELGVEPQREGEQELEQERG